MGPRMLTYSLVIVLSILESSYSGPDAIYRRKRDVDCTTSAANLKDAVRSVTKAKDVRLEAEMMMKPFANWEEILMPGPLLIAILGEMAAISSVHGDLKHKQYTEAFADTVMQVWMKAWGSFSTANKNMDQIRLLTASIPGATVDILTILFRDSAIVNALLPQRLSSLVSVSNECQSLAQSVEASFTNTILLIKDSWEGFQKKNLDVMIDLKQLDISVASRILAAQMAKEVTESKLTDEADASKAAFNKVRSAWGTLAAEFVSGLDVVSGKVCMGAHSARTAQARVEEALVELHKESFETVKKENENLTVFLDEMRSHKIDFEAAKEMIIIGVDSLLRVKVHWVEMVDFFKMISNLIEYRLSRDVKSLVQSVKSVQSMPNYSADAFVKDLLYNQAFKVSNIAHLVNMISSTYCEVSQRYLMEQVSAPGRLFTLTRSNPLFQVKREKLQSGCEKAQKSIQALVIAKKQEFDLSIEARVDAINCQLGAAIPPMSAAEKKRIREDVNAGASAAKAAGDLDRDVSDFL